MASQAPPLLHGLVDPYIPTWFDNPLVTLDADLARPPLTLNHVLLTWGVQNMAAGAITLSKGLVQAEAPHLNLAGAMA